MRPPHSTNVELKLHSHPLRSNSLEEKGLSSLDTTSVNDDITHVANILVHSHASSVCPRAQFGMFELFRKPGRPARE